MFGTLKRVDTFVPDSKEMTPEQTADMLIHLTRNFVNCMSFCRKYYIIQPYLGPNFPKAYTDLPESVRTFIAKKRKENKG